VNKWYFYHLLKFESVPCPESASSRLIPMLVNCGVPTVHIARQAAGLILQGVVMPVAIGPCNIFYCNSCVYSLVLYKDGAGNHHAVNTTIRKRRVVEVKQIANPSTDFLISRCPRGRLRGVCVKSARAAARATLESSYHRAALLIYRYRRRAIATNFKTFLYKAFSYKEVSHG